MATKAYFSGMADRAGPGIPTLVVVSGPAGCGKTTLAHRLAAALGCPAICRDELKEGMARTQSDYSPEAGRRVGRPNAVGLLRRVTAAARTRRDRRCRSGVSGSRVDAQSRSRSRRSASSASCSATPIPRRAKRRVAEHAATRHVHADAALLSELERGDDYFTEFRRVSIAAPTIDVDTTDGYRPTIDDIVAFVDVR